MSELSANNNQGGINPRRQVPSDFPRILKFAAIGCLILLVMAVVGGYLAYRGVRGLVAGMVEKYTFDAPMEIPRMEASDDEVAEVSRRVGEFADALGAGKSPSTLMLSARDLNILIDRHPNWNEMSGRVHVDIDNEKLEGQISVPLDELGGIFEGRYLNGRAAFRIQVAAGRLLIHVDSVDVGGKPLPDEFLTALRGENLAEELNKDPDIKALLEKFESVSVRDGRLVVVSRAAGGRGD